MRNAVSLTLGIVLFLAGLALGLSGQITGSATPSATNTLLVTRTQTAFTTSTAFQTITIPSTSTFLTSETTTITTATASTTVTTTATVTREVSPVQLCFSPGSGCDDLLISWLDRANQTIHVLMYVFTSDPLGDALIRANSRGITVLVVVERESENTTGSEVQRLRANGIDVRLDGNSALMHNKVAVIDGAIVVTGSYNWSAAAEERNNENLLVLADADLAASYEATFGLIWDAAAP